MRIVAYGEDEALFGPVAVCLHQPISFFGASLPRAVCYFIKCECGAHQSLEKDPHLALAEGADRKVLLIDYLNSIPSHYSPTSQYFPLSFFGAGVANMGCDLAKCHHGQMSRLAVVNIKGILRRSVRVQSA